jgi:hypothetical protein
MSTESLKRKADATGEEESNKKPAVMEDLLMLTFVDLAEDGCRTEAYSRVYRVADLPKGGLDLLRSAIKQAGHEHVWGITHYQRRFTDNREELDYCLEGYEEKENMAEVDLDPIPVVHEIAFDTDTTEFTPKPNQRLVYTAHIFADR